MEDAGCQLEVGRTSLGWFLISFPANLLALLSVTHEHYDYFTFRLYLYSIPQCLSSCVHRFGHSHPTCILQTLLKGLCSPKGASTMNGPQDSQQQLGPKQAKNVTGAAKPMPLQVRPTRLPTLPTHPLLSVSLPYSKTRTLC